MGVAVRKGGSGDGEVWESRQGGSGRLVERFGDG